jgi:hypothetical protein
MSPSLDNISAMLPAARRALHIPELLEAILLELEVCDLKTLLISAQRVSRHWNRVISGSPRLQQALFFAPVHCQDNHAAKELRGSGNCDHKAREDNADIVGNSCNEACATPEPEYHHKYVRRINPLLSQAFPIFFKPDPNALHCKKSFNITAVNQSTRYDAFMYPKASWRRMLVRQPPVLSLAAWEYNQSNLGELGGLHYLGILKFPEDALRSGKWECEYPLPQCLGVQPGLVGLRMGQLYDIVVHINLLRFFTSFDLYWDGFDAVLADLRRWADHELVDQEWEWAQELMAEGNIDVMLRISSIGGEDEWTETLCQNIGAAFEEKFLFPGNPSMRSEWLRSSCGCYPIGNHCFHDSIAEYAWNPEKYYAGWESKLPSFKMQLPSILSPDRREYRLINGFGDRECAVPEESGAEEKEY